MEIIIGSCGLTSSLIFLLFAFLKDRPFVKAWPKDRKIKVAIAVFTVGGFFSVCRNLSGHSSDFSLKFLHLSSLGSAGAFLCNQKDEPVLPLVLFALWFFSWFIGCLFP